MCCVHKLMLGAFRQIARSDLALSCLPVRPCAWNSLTPSYTKTYVHFSYLSEFFLEREMFQTKVVEKIRPHILCSVSPPENLVVYETMRKNMGESDRPHSSILRRMGFACWIIKGADTLSEYVILAAFSLQHWLRERASVVRLYARCLSGVETG